jgi:hypothetical protein
LDQSSIDWPNNFTIKVLLWLPLVWCQNPGHHSVNKLTLLFL